MSKYDFLNFGVGISPQLLELIPTLQQNEKKILLRITRLLLQGKLYMIMEICRAFDAIFKEHLDGVYASPLIFPSKPLSYFKLFDVLSFLILLRIVS